MSLPGTTIKARCNGCGVTNHFLVCKEITHWKEELNDYDIAVGKNEYSLNRCLGCDSVHMRHDSSSSLQVDDQGNWQERSYYYPPRSSRNKPEWMNRITFFFAIDNNIRELIDEIYSALHSNFRRLATLGIRALLEEIMILKCGDTGTISGNMEAFFNLGHVAPKDQIIFRHALMEAGHAAMHRGYIPSPEELIVIMDLVEAIVASVYVHPQAAATLQAALPPRAGNP